MSQIDLAYTLHVQGDLKGAESIYWSMIRDGTDVLSAANNLFAILSQGQRSNDLRRLYESIEKELPGNPAWAARFYAQPLALGDFDAGWHWYEARRYAFPRQVANPGFTFPEWHGEPISSLLICPEQGRGDLVQFARYIPLVVKRGIKVTLLCRPELARLLSGLPATIVPMEGAINLPAHDRWAFVGSLPLLIGPPFEPPPPIEIAVPSRTGGGIGIVVAGAPNHPNDANRSLPPEDASELLALPGAVSLRPEDTGARDFQDTAEIVAGLDLVITVDTAAAHLAGSLGKPTWILLPAARTDWRWQRGRTDSPWYPSARLFRKQPKSDWKEVIMEVRAALQS